MEGGAVSSCCAAIVEHGAHFAVDVAHHEVVSGAQGAVLYQHGGHGSASAIQLGFENDAAGGTIRRGFEFLQIRHQADHFHQQIEIRFLLGGDIDKHRGAAPVFRHQAAIGQLLLDPVRQGVGLVDFVHRDNDGNFRRVRVVDGFEGLRHDAVVGRHHQHDDVGGFGSARTHARERFVTGRVEKHNLAAERRRLLS